MVLDRARETLKKYMYPKTGAIAGTVVGVVVAIANYDYGGLEMILRGSVQGVWTFSTVGFGMKGYELIAKKVKTRLSYPVAIAYGLSLGFFLPLAIHSVTMGEDPLRSAGAASIISGASAPIINYIMRKRYLVRGA